jgi:MSHA biogenesis protein MshO
MNTLSCKKPSCQKTSMAFTLVELVMVIVVLAILATGSVKFISQSARGMVDSAERQVLASTASIAMEKVLRQVRRALPNSVRAFEDNGNNCIEFVPILHSSEYVSVPIASAETDFDAIAFSNAVGGESGYVAVYSISESSVYGNSPDTDRSISTGSPRKRFYLVSDPISFCEDANGRLWRYQNYGFHPDSRNSIPTSGADSILIADSLQVNSLSFNILQAQLQRNAVIRMSLVIVRSNTSLESLELSQEVQLRNVP